MDTYTDFLCQSLLLVFYMSIGILVTVVGILVNVDAISQLFHEVLSLLIPCTSVFTYIVEYRTLETAAFQLMCHVVFGVLQFDTNANHASPSNPVWEESTDCKSMCHLSDTHLWSLLSDSWVAETPSVIFHSCLRPKYDCSEKKSKNTESIYVSFVRKKY